MAYRCKTCNAPFNVLDHGNKSYCSTYCQVLGSVFRSGEHPVNGPLNIEACWRWDGAWREYGYTPVMHIKQPDGRSTTRAPWKVAYEGEYGIPVGVNDRVEMTCGRTECVNPRHMKLKPSATSPATGAPPSQKAVASATGLRNPVLVATPNFVETSPEVVEKAANAAMRPALPTLSGDNAVQAMMADPLLGGMVALVLDDDFKIAKLVSQAMAPNHGGVQLLNFLRDNLDRELLATKARAVNGLTTDAVEAVQASYGGVAASALHQPQLMPGFTQIIRLTQEGPAGLAVQCDPALAADPVACAWTYVVDLDESRFEVYRGRNRTPLAPGDRFAFADGLPPLPARRVADGIDWHPPRQIASWSLYALPEPNEFLEQIEGVLQAEGGH